MQVLQGLDLDFSPLQGGDALGGSACGGESGDGSNARVDRSPADSLLVEPRFKTGGGVDDELNALAFDQVNYVGTPFFHFVNPLDGHSGVFQNVGRARRGYQLEAHVHKFAGHFADLWLVMIGDADEDGSLGGQLLARR